MKDQDGLWKSQEDIYPICDAIYHLHKKTTILALRHLHKNEMMGIFMGLVSNVIKTQLKVTENDKQSIIIYHIK